MRELYFIIGFFLFSGTSVFGQGLDVLISEEKTGKRIELYAENTTKDTLNVFLLVKAEGYRRSASKPILKDIAPGAKVAMTTLIEIEGVPSHYTYDLIANKGRTDLNVTVSQDIRNIESVINNRIVVFEIPGCEKCDALKTRLEEARITHRAFNIHKDKILYKQFMSFIERSLTTETKIEFPVIWNRDHTLFGYNDLETILSKLKTD